MRGINTTIIGLLLIALLASGCVEGNASGKTYILDLMDQNGQDVNFPVAWIGTLFTDLLITVQDINVEGDANFTNVGIAGNTFLDNLLGTGNLSFVNSSNESMFWNSSRGSFSAGNTVSADGWYSQSFGYNNQSTGNYATTFGKDNIASGIYSFVVGQDSVGTQENAFATGYQSLALGPESIAMGFNPISKGIGSFAAGYAVFSARIKASGNGAVAMGYADTNTLASGKGSVALGYNARSFGEASVALGKDVNCFADNQVCLQDLNGLGDANFTNLEADNIYSAGTGTFGDLIVDTNTLVVDKVNHRVGIGITTPTEKLHIARGGNNANIILETYWAQVGSSSAWMLRNSYNDTVGTTTTTPDGSTIGQINFQGVDSGNNWDYGAYILAKQDGIAGARVPTNLSFVTTSSTGFNANQLVLHNTGNVGIGTDTPTTELEVIGTGTFGDIAIGNVDITQPIANFLAVRTATANSDTTLQSRGRGTGAGLAQFRSGGSQVIWTLGAYNSGTASIDVAGSAPLRLSFISNSTVPVQFFRGGVEDRTQYVGIYGYRAGDEERGLRIAVGIDADDTASFYQIGNYYFAGNIGIKTATPKIALQVEGDGNTSGDFNAGGNTVLKGNLTVEGEANIPATYMQASDVSDQSFAATGTPYSIELDTIDENFGISRIEDGNILIRSTGVYYIAAQPQVTASSGQSGVFHMWIQRDTGGGFADIANTNIELSLGSQEEDVILLIALESLNDGDQIRLRASVSNAGITLDTQSPVGEPVIPSIIFSMYKIGT